MRFFGKLFLVMALAGLPATAIAKPTTMQCLVDTSKSKGWIAEQIFIEYDPATDAARVVDGIVLHFNKRQPATAKITENSDKKLVVVWDVNTRVNRQTAKMAYRAAFLKPTGKVLVTAKPHGFADNLTGRGRCQPISTGLPTG